jgi:hypothetical protein
VLEKRACLYAFILLLAESNAAALSASVGDYTGELSACASADARVRTPCPAFRMPYHAMWRRALLKAKDYAQRGERCSPHTLGRHSRRTPAVRDGAPPAELALFRFQDEAALAKWQTYSDREFGGLSTASLRLSEQGAAPRFSLLSWFSRLPQATMLF